MLARAPLAGASFKSMVLGLDTPFKQGLFATYVLLWVSSHLLVYSSRRAGAPPYNPASVVLLTEVRLSRRFFRLHLRSSQHALFRRSRQRHQLQRYCCWLCCRRRFHNPATATSSSPPPCSQCSAPAGPHAQAVKEG